MTLIKSIYRGVGMAAGVMAAPLFILFSRKDRVRVMMLRRNGDVLLVRGYIGRQQWALPGGGVKRGESYEQAAVREVCEETGVVIDQELRYLGRALSRESLSRESFCAFPVRVYQAVVDDGKLQYNREIIEARWMPIDKIPSEYRSVQ